MVEVRQIATNPRGSLGGAVAAVLGHISITALKALIHLLPVIGSKLPYDNVGLHAKLRSLRTTQPRL